MSAKTVPCSPKLAKKKRDGMTQRKSIGVLKGVGGKIKGKGGAGVLLHGSKEHKTRPPQKDHRMMEGDGEGETRR